MKLSATFTPERLGAGTTVRVAFRIGPVASRAPSPVTEVGMFYPAGLGIGSSDLGLETCPPAMLEAQGLSGCPANSVMGYGSALVEVPFGPRAVRERAAIGITSGPLQNGHLGLLFAASGEYPVIANLVFSAQLLPAGARYGGVIQTTLPLVPSVPAGPPVALVGLQTTIGPPGVTYHERIGGRDVAFHPRGILLPPSCPPGGFPFAVHLSFLDGSLARASTSVPCPGGPETKRATRQLRHASQRHS